MTSPPVNSDLPDIPQPPPVELDRSLHGTTELRIHGVSGTPPESMLQHPHVRLVAGNSKAGFYRRWFPGGATRDVPDKEHLEAYSWGGLTSGGGSRALWLLLLPFALVNLASWTEPGRPDEALARRRVLEALLRLFGLTLTLTFVLAIATISMDIFAWQCAIPGSHCAAQDSFAGWVARLGEPGRRLGFSVLIPAAVVALFWYLGHRTWRDYERNQMPSDAGREQDFSLADPRFWNGDLPVERLRAVHITAAWMLLALLVIDPIRRHFGSVDSPWWLPAVAVETVAAGLGLASLVLSMSPSMADRRESSAAVAGEPKPHVVWRALPVFGLVVFLAALALTGAPETSGWLSQGPMPLLSGMLHTGYVIQAALLVILLVVNWLLPRDPAPLVPIAVRGHALPLLATIGWLLAGGFAAGLAVRTAEWLGKPVADGAGHQRVLNDREALASSPWLGDRVAAINAPEPLYVPAPFTWVALVAALLTIVVLPVLVTGSAYRLKRLIEEHSDRIRAEEPQGDPTRIRAVARVHALANMSDYAPRYLGRAILAGSVFVLIGTVMYAIDRSWPQDNLPLLTGFGSWAVGVAALLLVALGRAAYRTPALRRTVGILWDLASFWPRAAHPLAPPCYSERVLPDLVERTQALTSGERDRLLLSAHSQGTVIALAAVLQMPTDVAGRTGLLTYGSPLTRLYAAFFPGYVNREAYADAVRHLGSDVSATAGWPWRNLYRLSDPIGGWVLAPASGPAGDEVDRRLVDPLFARPLGDPSWPQPYGHSDYFSDEEFAAVSKRVLELRG